MTKEALFVPIREKYDELIELNDKKIKELYDHFLEEGSV